MPPDDSDLVQTAIRLYYMGGRKEKRLNHFGKLYPEFSEICNTILDKTENYDNEELAKFIEDMYDPKEKKLNEELIFSKKL
ncbi:MAG: hypothetical protein PHS45_04185 [Bacilli bacterium]|nr:hypothetical protein [Bacilli bacterium]